MKETAIQFQYRVLCSILIDPQSIEKLRSARRSQWELSKTQVVAQKVPQKCNAAILDGHIR